MTSLLDPMIGTTINDYVIQKELARGGMGVVYLAIHPTLKKKKIFKLLVFEYEHIPAAQERFQREGRALAKLDYPHIVPVDNLSQLPDRRWILTMPFVEGIPLDQHLAQHGKLSLHDAGYVICQLLGALSHAHDVGLIHRDIKPSNLLVQKRGKDPFWIVVIDFGISRDVTSAERNPLTEHGSVVGTPSYMAPEQFDSAYSVRPSADVYAVGCLLYELLTGEPLWGFGDQRAILFRQMKEPPEFPPDMNPEIAALIRWCVEVQPENRPQSMRAVASVLASAIPAIHERGLGDGVSILDRAAPELRLAADSNTETIRGNSQRGLSYAPPRETSLTPPPNTPPTPPRSFGVVAPAVSASPTVPPEFDGRTERTFDAVPPGDLQSTVRGIRPRSPEPVPRLEVPSPTSSAERATTPSRPAVIPTSPASGQRRSRLWAPILLALLAAVVVVVILLANRGPKTPTTVALGGAAMDAAPVPAIVPTAKTVPRDAGLDASDVGADATVYPVADALVDAPVARDAGTVANPSSSSDRPTPPKPVPAPAMADLIVSISPWAEVFTEGRLLGQAPRKFRLKAGTYHLVLVNKDRDKREAITVTLDAAHPTTIQRAW